MRVVIALSFFMTIVIPSISNAQGYGNRYGNSSNSPHVYGSDGRYMGDLNDNKYDANSVSNPYGRYGSQYSNDSINNPYSRR